MIVKQFKKGKILMIRANSNTHFQTCETCPREPQKQPSRGAPRKRCPQNMQQIHVDMSTPPEATHGTKSTPKNKA